MTRISPAVVAVMISLSVLLPPTMGQPCDPDFGPDCNWPEGTELQLFTNATEPFIKPCSLTPPCRRSGPDSWWHCAVGRASKGCKTVGPFRSSDCSAQCTFSPATADSATLHAYKFDISFVPANEPRRTFSPFFHIPAGRVERICIESCNASRGFNEPGSLTSFYNRPATIQLYEVIKEGISAGRGRPLPVSQQGLTVAREQLPALCFQSASCDYVGLYPTSQCRRMCFDNKDSALDLVPGDRVAVGVTLDGQYGDYLRLSNLVISVYSE